MKKIYQRFLFAVLLFFAGLATVSAQGLAPQDKPVMSIGCLSDLHNELGLISSSNLDNVRLRGTILNTVNKMREEEDIDLVVLGGDYTSDVTIPEANWERIRDLMHDALRTAFHPEREKKPVIYVTGNHDYEVANFDNLPKSYNAARYYDFIMKDDIGELTEKDAFYEDADNGTLGTERLLAAFHYEICGFDFVALNCGKFFFKSAWDYSYSLASVEWVGQKLAELYADSPNRTVFFLLHLPFQDSNSISNINKGMGGRGSAEGVQSAQRLKEILAQYPNVIMLYGHDHGSDNAYIRSKTSQRVTRYNTMGNVIATTDATHVDEVLEGQGQTGGGEDEPYVPETGSVKGYFKSYSGDGYMNYLSTDANLQCGTSKTEATIAASTTMKDRYTILLNGGYTHLGSTAHFTGNTAITNYSSPYIFKVENPAAATVKAHRVHKLSEFNNGGHFVILGYAKKDGQWYMMSSNNVTITYPGLEAILYSADEPSEDIEFAAVAEHAPIWEFECTQPKEDNTNPGTQEEPAAVSAYLESFSGDGWMNYVGTTENLQCGETKHLVTFAHATAQTGRFTLKVNNTAYTHLGSTAHFTGNTAISDYSTPYIYHVQAPKAGEKVKAQRVSSLLELKNAYSLTSTGARIISNSSDSWTATVVLDKGTSSGIAVGMPVTDSVGVIGQIIACGPTTATVRLIVDESSGVSAMVQSSRAQGVLKGSATGSLRLTLIRTDQTVAVGDTVVTSGLGGVFPKGLPLGKVVSVEKPTGAPYSDIVVEPLSSAESLEEVLVITSVTAEQQATAEDIAEADAQETSGLENDDAMKPQELSDDSVTYDDVEY